MLPLLALAGVTTDAVVNKGDATRWSFNKAKSFVSGDENENNSNTLLNIPGMSNLGEGDNGLLDFLGDHWGKSASVAGLGALWMSPAPSFFKKLATAAVLIVAVVSYFQNQNKSEFNVASGAENGRHNVLEKGINLDDPNMVGQKGTVFYADDDHDSKPEPEQT